MSGDLQTPLILDKASTSVIGMEQSCVWSQGDQCQVKWSGDGNVYNAKVRKILRNRKSYNLKALIHFDGFTSEDDEEVEIEMLHRLPTKQTHQSPSTRPPVRGDITSSNVAAPMFSPLRANEEQERLNEKFRIWDKEEEESMLETPVRTNPWRTKSRVLVGDLSPVSPRKRRKPTVVKVVSEQGRKADSPVSSGIFPRSSISNEKEEIDVPTKVPPKKSVTLSLQLSESEDDERPISGNFAPSGFEDSEMEKPQFKHKPTYPKVRFVISAPGVHKEICIPATINQYLYEYQREGIRFLYKLYNKGQGAILGDDMGLGKTVQVIGFLAALLRKTGTKTDVLKQRPKFIRELSNDEDSDDDGTERKMYLIIGPASVLYNWVDELDTWGHFTVGKFHKHHKQQTLADLDKKKLDIVVTTYETCRDHLRDLNRYNWDAVIADEAHKIKGMKAEVTQALKALKCRRRYGLTGTALQNHLKELWCIFDWANPGCLGTVYQFEEKFEKAILAGQKQDATKRQLADARKAKEKFAAIRSKWFLRRTKALIADQLPQKIEQVVYCRPTTFQLDVYKGILGHPDIQLILTQKDPCPCKSGHIRGKCHYRKSEDGRSVNQLIFSYLHLLIKTANHVALLMPEKTGNENQRRQAEDICDVAFAKHPHFRELTQKVAFRTLSDPKYCGKMKVLAGLLKVFKKENSKVLLFSLSTQLLDIIEQYVITTGYEYRRIDGKVSDVRRVQIVHEFNRDPNIFLFLASTKAGGVGLNMTGANVVIIYDPNWNPTHDIQAQDRAYRIGQGRDVRVYRLITMGTIEENIYLRQVFKQQLDRIAVSEENAKRLFYENEIKGVANMFKLRSTDTCLTMDILERNEKIETSVRGFTVGRYIPPPSKEQILCDNKEDDQDEKSEGSGDEVDYFCSQSMESGDMSEPGYESDESEAEYKDSERRKRKQRRKPSSESSSSVFSDLIPCKQTISSRKCTKDESPNIEKKTQYRTSAEPIASTSKATYGGRTSKVMVESSSNEEDVPIRRQDSTLGVLGSVSSVTDVFEQYAVPHMHENQKLIGASKAEDHMTKCAIQDVYELHQYSQVPAAFCGPCSESSEESDDIGRVTVKKSTSPEKASKKAGGVVESRITKGACSMVIGKKKVLMGQTPLGIRRKQFAEIAKFVAKDKVTLAKAILTSPSEEQQELLKRFYLNKDATLSLAFESPTEITATAGQISTRKQSSKSGGGRKKNVLPKRAVEKRPMTEKGCHYLSESDGDEAILPGKLEVPGLRRKRSRQQIISSDSEDGGPEVLRKRISSSVSNEITDANDGSKCEKEPECPGKSPRVRSPNPLDDLLDDILGEGSFTSKKKSPGFRQRQTQSPGSARQIRPMNKQYEDGAGGKKLCTTSIIDEIIDDSTCNDMIKSPPKKNLVKTPERRSKKEFTFSATSPQIKNSTPPSESESYKRSIIDEIIDERNYVVKTPPKKSPAKSPKLKSRKEIPLSATSPQIKRPNHPSDIESYTRGIVDEIVECNSDIVKMPPKKSPDKTRERRCGNVFTCIAVSPHKRSSNQPSAQMTSNDDPAKLDKSHLLDDLDIFNDEKITRKTAPKRKHLPSYGKTNEKIDEVVNEKEDSFGENSIDLFIGECKVNLNPTQDSFSEWERELEAISPKKKPKKTRKR